MMSSPVPRARALLRLAQLSGLTATYTSELFQKTTTPAAAAELMQRWSRELCSVLGLELEVSGTPPRPGALLVANHRSYLDVVALASRTPTLLLLPMRVASWPVVGLGARRAHSIFVNREDWRSRRDAREQVRALLNQGVSVTAFPEATATPGPGVLPFRPGLFQAVVGTTHPVVPVALRYPEPEDAWVGDEPLTQHFLRRFSRPRMKVELTFGPAIRDASASLVREQCERWIANTLGQAEGASLRAPAGHAAEPRRAVS